MTTNGEHNQWLRDPFLNGNDCLYDKTWGLILRAWGRNGNNPSWDCKDQTPPNPNPNTKQKQPLKASHHCFKPPNTIANSSFLLVRFDLTRAWVMHVFSDQRTHLPRSAFKNWSLWLSPGLRVKKGGHLMCLVCGNCCRQGLMSLAGVWKNMLWHCSSASLDSGWIELQQGFVLIDCNTSQKYST